MHSNDSKNNNSQHKNNSGTHSTSKNSPQKLTRNNSPNNNNCNDNNNSNSTSQNKNNKNNHNSGKKKQNSLLDKPRQDNDAKSTSAMSNLSSYSLIDDDHIDDQESINVGNLIIDLETDLEKEKIEKEQQSSAKPSTTTGSLAGNAPTSSTQSVSRPSYVAKASSSTSCTPNTQSVKSNQKSSNKHCTPDTVNSNCGTINSSTSGNSNNGNLMTTRTVFKSSSDERGELKMRITRETKPGKSEHKIVSSPNQKSPTSSSNNIHLLSNNDIDANVGALTSQTSYENINSNDSCLKPTQSSSISSTKECGTSTSIGTITEPECLGPCEPGTSVTLEGIVWQETEGGILVVNVTWRGKTYVGALLDCTKHDWAPPRLCDSPTSDIDSRAHKSVRTKRVVTRSNGIGLDEKNLLQTTGKLRNGKGRRILTSNDPVSCNKRQRESEKTNENSQSEAVTPAANVASLNDSENACVPMSIDTIPSGNNETVSTSRTISEKSGPDSPVLIGCNEPNCSKKFRNMNGLMYHQAHAHCSENDQSNAQDNQSPPEDVDMKTTAESVPDKEQSEQRVMHETQDDVNQEKMNQSESKPDEFQPEKRSQVAESRQQTPSPRLCHKMSSQSNLDIANSSSATMNQEPRQVMKSSDLERRNSSSSLPGHSNQDHYARKSPAPLLRSSQEQGHGSNNHNTSRSGSSNSKLSNAPPLPTPAEEGMKPSGTSTGPPPAPHQANCFFNQAFMANHFNPYGMAPYFPRSPLHMYDSLAPATSTAANAALLSRFMSNMRAPPPPTSPSRLLSPSVSKNLPFPPFKVDPGIIPPPAPPMMNPPLPPIPPLAANPPLAAGSPHLRMPSHGDPMLPPTSQPPFPHPVGLNPILGLQNSVNPLGPMGGPQVPSLVDDTLSKFPRRFN